MKNHNVCTSNSVNKPLYPRSEVTLFSFLIIGIFKKKKIQLFPNQVHLLWWPAFCHGPTALWAHPSRHHQGHCYPLCPSERLPCGPTVWLGLSWLARGENPSSWTIKSQQQVFMWIHKFILVSSMWLVLCVSLQEYEIDKTLGIKGPEDVAKMGIAEYNKQCRSIVMRYSNEWEVSLSDFYQSWVVCVDVPGDLNFCVFCFFFFWFTDFSEANGKVDWLQEWL